MTQTVEANKMSDIISSIETMSVLELSELVKALETKFGVSAASMAAPRVSTSVSRRGVPDACAPSAAA